MAIKYPHIVVRLDEVDDNFTIAGLVSNALRMNGASKDDRIEFTEQTAYVSKDEQLEIARQWVTVQ